MRLFSGIKNNMRKAEATAVLISACAFSSVALAGVTIPELQRDAKLSEHIAEYTECLNSGQSEFFEGSDDVRFLVEHITALCESKVDKAVSRVVALGADSDLARIIETSIKKAGKEQLTSSILKNKVRLK